VLSRTFKLSTILHELQVADRSQAILRDREAGLG
jgi:hypothetical protein